MEGEEGRGKANATIPVTDQRSDSSGGRNDETYTGLQLRARQRTGSRRGEGGAATFDGKWVKVIEEILERREGGLIVKENDGMYEKRP